MRRSGAVRPNYRARELPFPFGIARARGRRIALIPLMLIARLAGTHVFHPAITPIAVYCLGVIGLGLLDDTLGGPDPGRAADDPGGPVRRCRRGLARAPRRPAPG